MPPLSKAKWTALYERLSRDDDHYGDSVSVAHQKTYLRKYADDHGYTNCHDYADDGWSGSNFDRPAWKQMIADIEAGKIDTVIVKDMSRVGRDYLQTGFYTEVYFGKQGVHFIAIDSNVDNQRSDSNEFAPILNVFNEMYLHDHSRKLKIGFAAKGRSGKHMSVTPNFGYTHDPKDPQKWFIDPIPAGTVRRIFQLAAEGVNPHKIAAIMREEKRVTPSWYFAQQGKFNRATKIRENATPYNGLTEAKVHLALGLPTTWTGRQREDYRQYMMRKREVAYVFNDVLYRISFVDCSIFPQGYAGMVRIIDDDKRNNGFAGFAGTVMMADIGNGTMNIMQLQNGRPDEKHCWTEVLGVNQCVLTAKKQMMDKYGIDLPEQTIENYLRTGQARLRQEYLDQLRSIVCGYVTGLFDSLRAHGYDSRMIPLYIMGGGGCLVKNFGVYDKESVIFIDDLHASAKGYEYMTLGMLWSRERANR